MAQAFSQLHLLKCLHDEGGFAKKHLNIENNGGLHWECGRPRPQPNSSLAEDAQHSYSPVIAGEDAPRSLLAAFISLSHFLGKADEGTRVARGYRHFLSRPSPPCCRVKVPITCLELVSVIVRVISWPFTLPE